MKKDYKINYCYYLKNLHRLVAIMEEVANNTVEEAEVVLKIEIEGVAHRNLTQGEGRSPGLDHVKEKKIMIVTDRRITDHQSITIIEIIETGIEISTMEETEIIEVMMVGGIEIEYQKIIDKN